MSTEIVKQSPVKLCPHANFAFARNAELKAIAPYSKDDDLKRAYLWRSIVALNQMVNNDKYLQACHPEAIFWEFATGIMMGVEFGAMQEAFIIAYGGKPQLQFGYPYYRRAIIQTGHYREVHTHLVYEKEVDNFVWRYGMNPTIEHYPTLDPEPGEVVAGYAIAMPTDQNRTPFFEVMPIHQIDAIMKKSKAYQGGLKDPKRRNTAWWDLEVGRPQMQRKTVLIRLAKSMPMTAQLSQAINIEESFDFDRQRVLESEFAERMESLEREVRSTGTVGKIAGMKDKLKSDQVIEVEAETVEMSEPPPAKEEPKKQTVMDKLIDRIDELDRAGKSKRVTEVLNAYGVDTNQYTEADDETASKILKELKND